MTNNKELSLGDRMKMFYEDRYRLFLPMRMPVIIRLDGKAFHTLTKNLNKPFDNKFLVAMQNTALKLCSFIQGARVAYVQSDEINIFLHNYSKLNSCAWFDNNIQKIVSISAANASVEFTKQFGRDAYFDSRCFVLPEHELNNFFVWRQRDWMRNSIQMLARSLFSHKECENKNNNELQEMVFKKANINWAKLDGVYKNGSCIVKSQNKDGVQNWSVDNDIPVFSQHSKYIEKFLVTEE